MGSRRKARILAMQALFSWEVSKTPLEDLLGFAWTNDPKQEDDSIAFARLLVAGTVENIAQVDAAISAHLEHWEIGRVAKVDLAILRTGAYALLFQRDIPVSVTIDEAIDIAKEFGSDESYRFVNGVLDAIKKHLPA